MSWDKQTARQSGIPATVECLETLHIPYNLKLIGAVSDRAEWSSPDDEIGLYRLAYQDIIILERMERTSDCDTDDIVRSYVFAKTNDPTETWEVEITIDNC
jgi:hypothetical protein